MTRLRPSTRRPRARRSLTALAAAALLAALTGCTAAVVDEGAPPTAAPAVVTGSGFACPDAGRLGALSAIPFTSSGASTDTCAYVGGDGEARIDVVIRHGEGDAAPGVQTLASVRSEVAEGMRVRAAEGFSPDAFTARRSGAECTAWVYAADGVVTGVTARRASGVEQSACSLATTTAVVMGTAEQAATPVVSVIAPDGLLATTGTTDAWTTDLEQAEDVRVAVTADPGAGYLPADGSPGFGAAAGRVDPASAAVVLVSDASDAGRPRLAVLQAATEAFSTASTTAARARLVVVGPVRTADVSEADLTRLRADLRSAARVAGAEYIDPALQSSGTRTTDPQRQLTAAASAVARLLRTEALQPSAS